MNKNIIHFIQLFFQIILILNQFKFKYHQSNFILNFDIIYSVILIKYLILIIS